MTTTDIHDAAFFQHLADHSIVLDLDLLDEDGIAPSNQADIKLRLTQRRRSLSPSAFTNVDHARFKKENLAAQNANSVMRDSLPMIARHPDIPHSRGVRFNNLKPLTDGGIPPAFPALYDGCHLEELDRSVREELETYIVPSSNTFVPCLPTFFTECKGPTGSVQEGKCKILYPGALAARAVHQLRCFTTGPTTALDDNAYVITALYDSPTGLLELYATRPIASQKRDDFSKHLPIEYRMTSIGQFMMNYTPDMFREGAQAYRNAREWAKEQRDELVRAANLKARSRSLASGTMVPPPAATTGAR